ncbi:hypothetical protein RJ639_014384 [Escallonia herrerae]|uniref:Mechanosensitive ion channel protein 2, chloroplastic-like n=1 Tax=Escallonia herrerae TaxID=1293975 RepID=A0AA88VK55_9ASTE|nr:hypothetical protein RJ639_014384 [Escallonia herrerae]
MAVSSLKMEIKSDMVVPEQAERKSGIRIDFHIILISKSLNWFLHAMRSCSAIQGKSLVLKFIPAVGIVVFAKSDNSWRKSRMHYVMTSYLRPLLLWTGATLICRALDPVVVSSEASQIVKQRLLTFVRSLSTVLAFAYCLSSVIQQAQKFFMETNDPTDTRNMGFQFAGKTVYTAVWVAAISLFMELLGFSTQRWLTAGGLGTVLLTLAGREIFTNFLSSAMIHATRPFVVNEWIQTKIEGYEVSGTVEHVGWWSPTIVRGEDREAVHIPNHKFTVNVVRNLSQKTHWRIKTHLAISHLDVNKINNIVADMRKVLAKNPQVEQQKLHRRVFLENVNPENQALLICAAENSTGNSSFVLALAHIAAAEGLKGAMGLNPQNLSLQCLKALAGVELKLNLTVPFLSSSKSPPEKADLSSYISTPKLPEKPTLILQEKPELCKQTPPAKILVSCFVKTSHFEEYLCVKAMMNGQQSASFLLKYLHVTSQLILIFLLINTKQEAIMLDLLRVISHHRARLATPIRTVQKIYSDSDLEAFADSVFNRGAAASNRPLLLIEPSYKVNGEDRTKTRSVRTNGEQDSKAAVRPTPDNKADAKGGATPPPDNKAKERSTSDFKARETSISDTKSDARAGEKANYDSKEDHKVASTSISDSKLDDKTNAKSSNPVPKNESRPHISDNSSRNSSANKQPKNAVSGSSRQSSVVDNTSASLSETSAEKAGSSPSTKQGERQLPTSRPGLEDNLVLGVALEGSKRTLPIEEEMVTSTTPAEQKELATCRSGSGSPPAAEKDKKDGQNLNVPGSSSGDN